MKKSLSIIVLLSIGILCTYCYSGRNTITSLETDVPVTEGITDTSLTTVTETMLQTSIKVLEIIQQSNFAIIWK